MTRKVAQCGCQLNTPSPYPSSPTRAPCCCRNVTSHIDALALAPYFGAVPLSNDTLDTFMNKALPGGALDVKRWIAPHYTVAAEFGKRLIAYECGQSLGGTGITYQVR